MEAYITTVEDNGESAIVTFAGCDYRCRYCNTPHLLDQPTGEQRNLREVIAEVEATGKEHVLFTGGEPLLQKAALQALLTTCKQKGMRTIIDTNASKPEALKTLLDENVVDEWRVDVKAPPHAFDAVTKASTFFKPATELWNEFAASIALLRERQDEVRLSFRTVITPGLVYKKEDVVAIAALLEGIDAEWTLAAFNPERTLDTSLSGVAPPTRKFLEHLADFVRKAYPNTRVRVKS